MNKPISEQNLETIIVVEDNVIQFPTDLRFYPPSFLRADKEVMGIPIKFLYVKYHGDGTCGLYDKDGKRYEG
jgi:hypothetical protein